MDLTPGGDFQDPDAEKFRSKKNGSHQFSKRVAYVKGDKKFQTNHGDRKISNARPSLNLSRAAQKT